MGLFSFVGSLFGAGSAKKASRKAEQAQLAYLQKALDEEIRQRDQTRADLAPERNIGTAALGPLGDLIGVNGVDSQGAAIAALKDSPQFRALFDTGQETLLQTGAATGGLRGGNMQDALARFGSDTLAQVIQDQIGRLGGLASFGLGAKTTSAGAGADAAHAIAQLFSNQGQVRAGGLLTRGGINNSMWNSAGSFLDSAVKAMLPGGGGLGKLF